MRNNIESFRGEAPRLTPRALPPNGAQEATLARLLSGDLEAWRQFALEQALDNTGPVLSIYELGTIWLAWDHDVDVARGALAGDTALRIFITGPEEYDRPRWTNLSLAGAGNGPPAETRPLGVPPPDGAPVVVPGLDPTPSSFAIDILDEGDVLSTQWQTSPPVNQATFNSNVVQDAVDGNPAPCYQMSWRDQEVGTNLRRNFGVGKANAVTMTCDFFVNTVAGRSRFWAGVQRNEAGAGVSVQVDQLAAGDWYLSIGTGSDWGQGQNQSTLVTSGVSHDVLTDTWFRLVVSVVTNLDNTITVTASVKDLADVEVLTATSGVTCPLGDWCGFGSGFDQLGDTSLARLDNIHVQAAGSTGYNPVNTATAYVYTYVNDQSEESAPSFASIDVLRPAGIAITVSTPTDVPTGIDSSWHIETKRIYRTVSGASGNIFRFVAEIPLAQQDYVDNVPDTELGEALESEGWDLPPVGMRGILALPNSVMAGFSGNQLCLSAPNRPHAWPVANRYTVDTAVVAIGNIDTTVVLGTEAFPYLAIGTDPAAYGMTKLEVPQACVAKRSLAYLTGFGVVFASPDGLIAINGNGSVQNLTSGVFTRKQWQALVPESILGAAHDDVYHFFYDTEPTPAEVALWLDTFDGVADSGLYSHTQNIQFNGSVWTFYSETGEPILSGLGSAIRNPASGGQPGAATDFTSGSSLPIPLQAGYRYEFDLTPLDTASSDNAQNRTIVIVGGVALTFIPAYEGHATFDLVLDVGDFSEETYPLSSGAQRLVLLVDVDGWTLTINDVAQTKVLAAGMPLYALGVSFQLGADFDAGVSPVPCGSVERMALYGSLDLSLFKLEATDSGIASQLFADQYTALFPTVTAYYSVIPALVFEFEGGSLVLGSSGTSSNEQISAAGLYSAVGTARSATNPISDTIVYVLELPLTAFDPTLSKLSIGFYDPDTGSTEDLALYLANKGTEASFVTSDGSGYDVIDGAVSGLPTFTAADVMAMVLDNSDPAQPLVFLKNGVPFTTRFALPNGFAGSFFASIEPLGGA